MLPFTLQQLRILKAVGTEKSFTKAAEILFLSQPYLSKQIKILEGNLGVSLFYRNSKIVTLTENGQIFLLYAERILVLCEESCRTLIDFKNGERGNLIVGASQTIGDYLMPRLLAIFTQNYPQINLKVAVNSTRLIATQINNRQIDLAIVESEVPQELKSKLNIEHFVTDELNLIIANSHPFAKREKIKKNDLYHIKFITLYSNSTICKFVDNILKQNNIDINQLDIVLQLNSIEAIKTAVSSGLGAAFIPTLTIEKELKLNTIQILEIENIKIKRTLSILSNSDGYKSKAFRFFYKHLINLKHTT